MFDSDRKELISLAGENINWAALDRTLLFFLLNATRNCKV